jgi:hypothetical protein
MNFGLPPALNGLILIQSAGKATWKLRGGMLEKCKLLELAETGTVKELPG